ncbi:DUF4129 domain-containing protein [Candidatus Palauibacter sp.]|uniref:DUF4129 domain-containing protein n=1 Tax=Candidatus Palauibacter sp. TaxID=3101350 RepID=UPI003B52D6EA
MTRFAWSATPFRGQEPPADPLPSPDEMSAVLREVLAESDFVTAALPLRQRIIQWIGEAIGEAWEWLRQLLFDDGSGLMTVLAILVPLAALVALGVLAFRHVPGWVGGASGEDDGGGGAGHTPRSAGEWLQLARSRAGEGDFRPAASALYQGFLLSLDEMGTLAFHPSKTPGDYALEIGRERRGGEGGAGAGTRFIRSFQRLSFGEEAPTSGGYADLATLARDAGCPGPDVPSEADGG